MKVLIKGHQTDIQPRWKSRILDRLEKLERFEDRIIKIEITLTASHHHLKGNESCHIFVKVPRKTIDVKKGADDMMSAIDAACKVMEQQVHKLWKDVKARNRHDKVARQAKRGVLVS
jgi:ribosomal subunit interface protein